MNARGLMELIILNIGSQKGSGTTRALFHYGHDGHQNNADDLSVVGARSSNKGQAITEEDTAMIKA